MTIKEFGGPKCGECRYFIPYTDVENGILKATGNNGRMGKCSNNKVETIKITFEGITATKAAVINCDLALAEQMAQRKIICFEQKGFSLN